MVLPVDGVSLQDKQAMNHLLLEIGAPIYEINAVRKHMSLIKGGGLLKMLQPAQVITLTQDTTPEQLPWPDPVLPDPTTFDDAIAILKKYEIWGRSPESIRNYLVRGTHEPALETMKSDSGIRHTILDTGNQRNACVAAMRYAKSKNYHAHILSTKIEGESRDVGSVLAGIAKEIQQYGRPFKAPCVLVSAGETRVALNGPCGKGGPNQELVLGFGLNIKNYDDIALVSIDSEGTDGPTEIAGGIVDSATVKRAREMGVDLFDALKTHDSSSALERLDGAVVTGPTGTNVVNLRVLVIGKK
jgi:glycerate-2-kinase